MTMLCFVDNVYLKLDACNGLGEGTSLFFVAVQFSGILLRLKRVLLTQAGCSPAILAMAQIW